MGMASNGPDEIRRQMRRVRELTQKPFGVDLLTAVPASLEAACDVIIEEGASCFVAGLGVPYPIMDRLKSAGLTVMTVCGQVKHAKKAEDGGWRRRHCSGYGSWRPHGQGRGHGAHPADR